MVRSSSPLLAPHFVREAWKLIKLMAPPTTDDVLPIDGFPITKASGSTDDLSLFAERSGVQVAFLGGLKKKPTSKRNKTTSPAGNKTFDAKVHKYVQLSIHLRAGQSGTKRKADFEVAKLELRHRWKRQMTGMDLKGKLNVLYKMEKSHMYQYGGKIADELWKISRDAAVLAPKAYRYDGDADTE